VCEGCHLLFWCGGGGLGGGFTEEGTHC
jgi:hypothetical protein